MALEARVNRTDEMVLKFREVLKETERLSPGDLWAYQKSLLTPLLLHAREHSPFYKKRLDVVFNGDDIDFDKWRHIPILTREEAQKNEKQLHAKMVPPHLGSVSADETSGSTGRPLRYLKNFLMSVAGLAMTDRLYRWWEFDGAQPLASFVSPRRQLSGNEGVENFGWYSGQLGGKIYLLDTSGDTDRHIDWLSRVKARYFVSYSSLIGPLAERVLERGIDLKFERVIARGGIVTEEMRALCDKAFGGVLVDQYGADEIGQIACQCPNCGAYHVNSEAVRMEVLDDEGKPSKPGETGRVVLTNLYNYAMPLIRYEIGDYATRVPEDHNCKIRLPAISRIVGRYRNTFTLEDGRVLFPNVPMSEFRKYLGYSQIQIVQTDYDKIEVKYVPDGSGRAADLEGLAEWLKGGIDPCFNIGVTQVETIPPSSDGKYEDFLSHVSKW